MGALIIDVDFTVAFTVGFGLIIGVFITVVFNAGLTIVVEFNKLSIWGWIIVDELIVLIFELLTVALI